MCGAEGQLEAVQAVLADPQRRDVSPPPRRHAGPNIEYGRDLRKELQRTAPGRTPPRPRARVDLVRPARRVRRRGSDGRADARPRLPWCSATPWTPSSATRPHAASSSAPEALRLRREWYSERRFGGVRTRGGPSSRRARSRPLWRRRSTPRDAPNTPRSSRRCTSACSPPRSEAKRMRDPARASSPTVPRARERRLARDDPNHRPRRGSRNSRVRSRRRGNRSRSRRRSWATLLHRPRASSRGRRVARSRKRRREEAAAWYYSKTRPPRSERSRCGRSAKTRSCAARTRGG